MKAVRVHQYGGPNCSNQRAIFSTRIPQLGLSKRKRSKP
jgi:hypothetical protein